MQMEFRQWLVTKRGVFAYLECLSSRSEIIIVYAQASSMCKVINLKM